MFAEHQHLLYQLKYVSVKYYNHTEYIPVVLHLKKYILMSKFTTSGQDYLFLTILTGIRMSRVIIEITSNTATLFSI